MGEKIQVVAPESVGLSGVQLTKLSNFFQSEYIDAGRLAGCMIAIARHGEVAHLSILGKADLERKRSMVEGDLFRIYSMSKPITSVALMTLYEDGLFQLGDPVSKFIPEWKNLEVYAGGKYPNWETKPCDREMTICDLLTHQSGIAAGSFGASGNYPEIEQAYRDIGLGPDYFQTKGLALKDTINALASVPLAFSPGDYWNYSISTDICGYLVEVISGRKFDMFLWDEIFDPLGMTDTSFEVDPSKASRLTSNYTYGSDGELELFDSATDSEFFGPISYFSGAAGLISTMSDYLRFAQMLLNKGELDGARIISPKTLDLMTLNHLTDGGTMQDREKKKSLSLRSPGHGFGLGFSMVVDVAQSESIGSVGEFRWGGAASTAFWVDPLEDLLVVFMTQLTRATTQIRPQLKSLIYPAIIDA
ncbi:MAG: serine hydrolase [Chloroflexota bacterium]|nr:serine hydrolase [Chloroflexota bacterium]